MRTRTKNPQLIGHPIDAATKGAVFGGAGGLSASAFMTKAKAPRAKHIRMSDLEVAIEAAEARSKSGEWVGCTSTILVGLYAVMHRTVYGIVPEELNVKSEMQRASAAARKIVTDFFGGDADDMVEYMIWAAKRAKSRKEWAVANGRDVVRLAWRFMFSASSVSDYRVEMSAKRKHDR